MKKEKANYFSNIVYAIKTVFKVDKVFVIQKLFVSIFRAVNTFIYAYILKVAIAGIEKGLPFGEVVTDVLWVVIVAFVASAITRIINAAWYRPSLIAMILNHKTTLRTLDMDYEILERPETQDLLEKTLRSLGGHSGIMGLLQRFFFSL